MEPALSEGECEHDGCGSGEEASRGEKGTYRVHGALVILSGAVGGEDEEESGGEEVNVCGVAPSSAAGNLPIPIARLHEF